MKSVGGRNNRIIEELDAIGREEARKLVKARMRDPTSLEEVFSLLLSLSVSVGRLLDLLSDPCSANLRGILSSSLDVHFVDLDGAFRIRAELHRSHFPAEQRRGSSIGRNQQHYGHHQRFHAKHPSYLRSILDD